MTDRTDLDATLQQAIAHHQAGRLAEADALYQSVIAADPNRVEAWNLLGVLAQQAGMHDVAVDLLSHAITLNDCLPELHFNLGNSLHALGDPAGEMGAYQRALALRPDYVEALANLGNSHHDAGHLPEAIECYRRALAKRPELAVVHFQLGLALHQSADLESASRAYRDALRLDASLAPAQANLGLALHGLGKLDEAVAAFTLAAAQTPDNAQVHQNLGALLLERGEPEAALPHLEAAVSREPGYAEALTNLGNAYAQLGRFDEALAVHQRSVKLAPRAEALVNLGNTLQALGRLDEAIASHRRALTLQPDLPSAHWNLALALLHAGQYPEGWREYEARWQVMPMALDKRDFPQPMWDGGALNGRRILLHAEQGLGDALQFIRYAPQVAARGGQVIVECAAGLVPLLRTVEGVTEVVARGEPLPAFDTHLPLMSLPRVFESTLENLPSAPYLRVDDARAAAWAARLPRDGALRVGLVWAGNPRLQLPVAGLIDRRRSLSLDAFAPLAGIEGVRFFSLQKGEAGAQARTPPPGLALEDPTADLRDFADTAALISQLDLVISVDTSVAHLAGGLGRPVWILSRYDGCWRWLHGRDDSPWYPSARLFRQSAPGDWAPVIAAVRDALAAHAVQGGSA